MDFNAVTQLITSVGFPIVACGAMGWYVKYTGDKHRAERQADRTEHKEENNKRMEEMKTISQAVTNNTIALTSLTEVLRGGK